jgi:CCR4-NOT transcription complex subunit 7/8
VLTEDVQWVCFHGIFDFAYLLKMLTGEEHLPSDEYQFQEALKLYFPHFYDLKSMATPFNNLQGGLSKLCQELKVFLI